MCLDIPDSDKPEFTINRTNFGRRNPDCGPNCAIIHRNSRYTGRFSYSGPVWCIETYLCFFFYEKKLHWSTHCHNVCLFCTTDTVPFYRAFHAVKRTNIRGWQSACMGFMKASVLPFQPKYRLGHPENYLFSLSKKAFSGSKYSHKKLI